MSKNTRIKNLLKKHGLSGVNKAKRTPKHPKKSHIVLAKVGDKVRLIRFGSRREQIRTPSNVSHSKRVMPRTLPRAR